MSEQSNIQEKAYNFDELFAELAVHNEVLETTQDPEALLVANLKILGIARKFAEIDEMLLGISGISDMSGTYFSKVLTFETLRLRFKEEITRCKDLNQIQT